MEKRSGYVLISVLKKGGVIAPWTKELRCGRGGGLRFLIWKRVSTLSVMNCAQAIVSDRGLCAKTSTKYCRVDKKIKGLPLGLSIPCVAEVLAQGPLTRGDLVSMSPK